MSEKHKELKSFFDELIGDNPKKIAKEKLMSLRQYPKYFKITRGFFRKWFDNYMDSRYGEKEAKRIRKILWPTSDELIQNKKFKFLEMFESQLIYYPKRINNFDSINGYEKKIGVSKRTITRWIIKSLSHIYGKRRALEIYKEIWSLKQATYKSITIDRLKTFIENRGAKLLTKENHFNIKEGNQKFKYVEIECKNSHPWRIRVDNLLYQGRWCPICLESKTESIMRMFMEKIFECRFPETPLIKAYNILANEGGRLKFDGFNGHVVINGKIFKIAFEYDGEQHDKYPNAFHKNYEEFLIQRNRDEIKKKIAENHDTVIIRLKKVNGFDYHNTKSFQKEIIKQFYEAKNIKLKNIKKYIYDSESHSLITKIPPINIFL
ncbi:MAG: hypothetical protein ACFFB0_20025 [Promethearchaeota archaeon]